MEAGYLTSLHGLAPGGVCHATPVASGPVRSYRTLSPLPVPPRGGHRRSALCGTFRRLAAPGRYPAPCPAELGLSSHDGLGRAWAILTRTLARYTSRPRQGSDDPGGSRTDGRHRMVPAMRSPGYDLDAVRKQIPILRTHIPMNNCSQAPQCERTRAAAAGYLDSWASDGMDWDAWMAEVEAARVEFAKLVGGEPEDVGVASSVSQATASVASGLDYTGRRHRVVVSGAEFPTVSHVWMAQERFGAEFFRRSPAALARSSSRG